MTLAVIIIAAAALALSVAALWLGWDGRTQAIRARAELARHRYSHTLDRDEDPPARRHGGQRPGPPRVDEHAAPATDVMRAQAPDPAPATTALPLPGRIGRERGPQ